MRFTYGLIGNDAIGAPSDRFFYLSEVDMDDDSKRHYFGLNNAYYRNGVTVDRYSNPKITWERSYKTNLGVNIGLFNNLDIVIDLWKEHRTHILMVRSDIPTTMGLPNSAIPRANIGEAEGHGIDLAGSYSKFFTNNFWLKVRGNLTYAISNFLVYEEPEYESAPWKSKVGYPLTQKWGYIAERLFVDKKEVLNSPTQNFGIQPMGGDIKYRDVDDDGKVTELDMVPIGYPTSPEIVYGFGASVGYKSFDFSFFFQGLARESFWIDSKSTAPFVINDYEYGGEELHLKNQLLKAYADNHWSEYNPDLYALWPRLSTSLNENNSQKSTWFMRNGAFLRLKNVEVGYTLPNRLTERLSIDMIRIYANGSNLYLFSPFELWDVEMAGDGLGYPIQRVINFGLQVSF